MKYLCLEIFKKYLKAEYNFCFMNYLILIIIAVILAGVAISLIKGMFKIIISGSIVVLIIILITSLFVYKDINSFKTALSNNDVAYIIINNSKTMYAFTVKNSNLNKLNSTELNKIKQNKNNVLFFIDNSLIKDNDISSFFESLRNPDFLISNLKTKKISIKPDYSFIKVISLIPTKVFKKTTDLITKYYPVKR